MGHQELEDRAEKLDCSFSARTQQTVLAWPSGHVGDMVKHRQKATWPVFTQTWTAFCCCQPGMASSKSCLSSVTAVFSAELIPPTSTQSASPGPQSATSIHSLMERLLCPGPGLRAGGVVTSKRERFPTSHSCRQLGEAHIITHAVCHCRSCCVLSREIRASVGWGAAADGVRGTGLRPRCTAG